MEQTATVPEITIETWPEQALPEPEIRAALTYLAYKTGKPVQFRRWARQLCYCDRAVALYICTRGVEPLRSGVEGLTLGGEDYFIPHGQPLHSDDGIEGAAVTDDTGLVLARVSHNCVIILLDITAQDSELARAVLAYVVERALPLLDFDVASLRNSRLKAFEDAFGRMTKTALHARLEDRRREAAEIDQAIQRAYYTIIDNEHARPAVQAELEALEALARTPGPRLVHRQAEALTAIQETGLYGHVECRTDGSLVARTSPITIDYAGWRFPMGPYEVTIAADGGVSIRNLEEHPEADHPHPHIGTDHRPCLGNVTSNVAKLIGRMRFAETLQIIHRFLSSYNPDGAYERISHFDPTGEYQDEDADPCDDCDEKCSPYCIHACDHNDYYTCSDCYEYRSAWCFESCEHNTDWSLQDPCDDCRESECKGETCPYHKKKCEVNDGK